MPRKSEKPFIKSEYANEYQKKNYEQVKTTFHKKLKIGKILDIASQKAGTSKREYIRQAIIDRLHKDGFDVEVKAEYNDKETGNSDKE